MVYLKPMPSASLGTQFPFEIKQTVLGGRGGLPFQGRSRFKLNGFLAGTICPVNGSRLQQKRNQAKIRHGRHTHMCFVAKVQLATGYFIQLFLVMQKPVSRRYKLTLWVYQVLYFECGPGRGSQCRFTGFGSPHFFPLLAQARGPSFFKQAMLGWRLRMLSLRTRPRTDLVPRARQTDRNGYWAFSWRHNHFQKTSMPCKEKF